jgi:dihydroorotate dehydrogenase
MGPLGPDFTGCTFVAKTTTLNFRVGNMPMRKDGITPKELIPECIIVDFWRKIMLNAVELSGPGAKALFDMGLWQNMKNPFFISFAPIALTVAERLEEIRKFVNLFKACLPGFKAPVGLQINESCPNIGGHTDYHADETIQFLREASRLGIPLMPKFNVLTPIPLAKKIAQDPNCDAICVSNTIHWRDLPAVNINRVMLFGSDISPLAKFGRGGLSGAPLLPLVADWAKRAKLAGIEKPINAGGGILAPDDLRKLKQAGVDSVSIGSVATLRPWRVRNIIKTAYELFA